MLIKYLRAFKRKRRFLAEHKNWKWAVFLFNFFLSLHHHICFVKYLFSNREDKFKSLCETNNLACEMFTSGVCPWFKNVACLSSLMFSFWTLSKLWNEIQFNALLMVTLLSAILSGLSSWIYVFNRFFSPSHVIWSFLSFRSFHRISVLVTSSGPFQPQPTYMGLEEPFSQN